MSSQHEISEYIDNLSFKKVLCKGFRPDDVYEAICNISSMYNQILSEAYAENEELKRTMEHMEARNRITGSSGKSEAGKESLETESAGKKNNELMTEKEFQKLKRADLLEILLAQSKENDSLKERLEDKNQEIDQLYERLNDRKIDLEKAGTIAEASFKLNGVFESAEKAAQQYLDNLQDLYEKEHILYSQREAEVENKCSALLQATNERCKFMKEDASKKCADMEADVKKRCEEMLSSTEKQCQEREKEAEDKCLALDLKAKADVDGRWNELSQRLEIFYMEHQGLREMLITSGEI